MKESQSAPAIHVAALYRFRRVDDPASLANQLREFCRTRRISGTLLVAAEGINGTLAGAGAAIDALVRFVQHDLNFGDLELKRSQAITPPFRRLKVRLKKEIVTMGVLGLDPAVDAGAYVDPADWNDLILDADTVVIDTRNAYETALGTFQGAVDPRMASFRDFPAWLSRRRELLEGKRVAMFCTGGIRCEKATAYARSIGLRQVFHLKGGILKYLEEVPAEESRWQGECFVFDERVSLSHGLQEGAAELCRACRHPLLPEDLESPHYIPGVSCHRCHDLHGEEDRKRFAERQRQVELSAARGGRPHLREP